MPLNPEIIEADTFMAAFDARHPNEEEQRVLRYARADGTARGLIACDHDAVSDLDAFLAAIAHGFGAAKAYGCGLMLIRRASQGMA